MRRNQVLPVASRVEVAALGTPARTIAPPWCSRHYRSARWPLPPGVAALVWADRPTYGGRRRCQRGLPLGIPATLIALSLPPPRWPPRHRRQRGPAPASSEAS